MIDILKEGIGLKEEIAKNRDYLHENPELSGREERTLQWIKEKLHSMEIPFTTVPHGGIVAVLDGVSPGKRLLLRSDIDALPVQENRCNLSKPKTVVSSIENVSHACGHDAHTSMLLGALQVLSDNRNQFCGQVVAVFEQGEEAAYGVFSILDYLAENFDGIDGCFAIHVNADVREGRLSVLPGYVMSGAFGFDVNLRGAGGHSARPDYCHNPIDCFVGIYNDLSGLRMRSTDPNDCVTYGVSIVEAGSKVNVIPGELRFAFMGRFFDLDACGRRVFHQAEKIIESNAAIYECTVDYNYIMQPTFGVYNSPQCAELAKECFSRDLGGGILTEAKPWMASETMSMYNALYHGVLAFLGIQNGKDFGAPHHSPEFDMDENLLYIGTEAFLSYTLAFLSDDYTAPERKSVKDILRKMEVFRD